MDKTKFRALLLRRFHIPRERSIERAVRRFTSAEKALFFFFAGVFTLTSVILLLRVNSSFLVDVPIRGGELTEGIVGNPRFINPVLAMSEADKAITSLIYSGLVKIKTNGEVVNDLAEKVEVSEDGLIYTVTIREDAVFHDKTPITADDVVFTIQKILDPNIKSPLFADFAGVNTESLDKKTVRFTLRKPYASFINTLSIGILPKHIWSSLTNDEFSFSQWNILPVGSGPYKVESVTRDSGGIPNFYDLTPFDRDVGGGVFVEHLTIKFYPSEFDLLEAFDSGKIDSLGGISPEDAVGIRNQGYKVLTSPLPRIFGVFFNQNANKALLDKSVREALNLSAPKEEIVRDVLKGFGQVIDSPLPAGLSGLSGEKETLLRKRDLELASSTLAKAGWVRNANTGILEKKSKTDTLVLSFSISTSDNPDLQKVAEILKTAWQEIGAEVKVSIYEAGDLNQNVIRPRKYDALLFGEVVGREADLYPFWYSSERNDPGLNIALYANSKVDKALESLRLERDKDTRTSMYKEIVQAIREDNPAVFLYSPSYIYVTPKRVEGISLDHLGASQDRFASVRDWFIETNAVWKIFVGNDQK